MSLNFYTGRSQKFRVAILIIGIILLIANLYTVDYGQLMSRENLSEAFGIISNLFLIAAMIVSIRYTAKKEEIN